MRSRDAASHTKTAIAFVRSQRAGRTARPAEVPFHANGPENISASPCRHGALGTTPTAGGKARHAWSSARYPQEAFGSSRLGQPAGRAVGSGIGQRLISAAVRWKKHVSALEHAAMAQKQKKPNE